MRAIVLSGGGAKGSYQIGVWKALRCLHIRYDIVTGSSVGSLNGALMTQNTFYRGLWFWHNIDFKRVFNNQMNSDYKTSEGKKRLFKQYVKGALLNNGLEATNLENNIDKVIDEQKIRKSKINFGIVTVNLSNLKPITLTKKNIPLGKLSDYLMASATCFPIFKKKNIDDANYIDGGYYDNLPINLAIDMGADEIIAIDLGTIGFKQRIKNKTIKITYIKPRNILGSFFIFDKDLARRGIRLGYNDTMKTFNRLDGNKYTFKHGHLSYNYKHHGQRYNEVLTSVLEKKNNLLAQILKTTTYKNDIQKKDFTSIIEHLGKTFEFDDSIIYSINKFNRLIIRELNKIPTVDKKFIEQELKSKKIKNVVNNKYVIKFMYDTLKNKFGHNQINEISSIALLFPHDFLDAIYLYVIQKDN